MTFSTHQRSIIIPSRFSYYCLCPFRSWSSSTRTGSTGTRTTSRGFLEEPSPLPCPRPPYGSMVDVESTFFFAETFVQRRFAEICVQKRRFTIHPTALGRVCDQPVYFIVAPTRYISCKSVLPHYSVPPFFSSRYSYLVLRVDVTLYLVISYWTLKPFDKLKFFWFTHLFDMTRLKVSNNQFLLIFR